MELQKDGDGNLVMRPADFRLHVSTGEEAEQQWPNVQVDEELMPLLDMPEAWQMVVDEEELPAKKKPKGELLDVNATIIVKEISYHILASTVPHPETADDKSEGEEDSKVETSSAAEKKEKPDAEEDRSRDPETKPEFEIPDPFKMKNKSVYGASLLLKLQWEDTTPQKAVPHRTHDEMGHFIGEVTKALTQVMEKNEKAGQAVLDTLASDLTLVLLGRYMEGVETGVKSLEDNAYELLTLCAERANAKEMCMPLRILVRRIDVVYVEPTSYLIVEPLLRLWTKLVLRIPRKRHYFLNDLIKTWERLFKHAESYELSYVDEDSDGVAKPGRLANVWDILLDFFGNLTQVQLKHRDACDKIRLKVDDLGHLLPDPSPHEASETSKAEVGSITKSEGNGEENEPAVPNAEKGSTATEEGQIPNEENKSSKEVTVDDEARDWVRERAMTLAQVLIIQGMVWNKIQPPPGEDRQSPHRKSKKHDKRAQADALLSKKNEQALARCHHLFMRLGWTNPVQVCQLAAGELNLKTWSRAEDLSRQHIKQDIRTKKERKGTMYSLGSVGHYICGAVRSPTRHLLAGDGQGSVDEYNVDLCGTGFDLLDPFYALDLALPFVMCLIADATPARSLNAILVARAFLNRIPKNGYESFDEVMRMRFSINAMGREANLVGLSQHLVKAVAGCDDPRHRRVAYETFQAVLEKVRVPDARFTITECAFHACKRVAVAAQLVTQMKDAVRYSDQCAEEGVLKWSEEQASSLKTRFVEIILPTYFAPRKEMLMSVNAIVTVAGVVIWLGGSDKRLLKRLPEGDKLRTGVEKRMKFVKEYCKLGRECIRALASVAEHDRKNMPKSQLAKSNTAEAQALFAASGRTLNNCMTALSLLTTADPYFQDVSTSS